MARRRRHAAAPAALRGRAASRWILSARRLLSESLARLPRTAAGWLSRSSPAWLRRVAAALLRLLCGPAHAGPQVPSGERQGGDAGEGSCPADAVPDSASAVIQPDLDETCDTAAKKTHSSVCDAAAAKKTHSSVCDAAAAKKTHSSDCDAAAAKKTHTSVCDSAAAKKTHNSVCDAAAAKKTHTSVCDAAAAKKTHTSVCDAAAAKKTDASVCDADAKNTHSSELKLLQEDARMGLRQEESESSSYTLLQQGRSSPPWESVKPRKGKWKAAHVVSSIPQPEIKVNNCAYCKKNGHRAKDCPGWKNVVIGCHRVVKDCPRRAKHEEDDLNLDLEEDDLNLDRLFAEDKVEEDVENKAHKTYPTVSACKNGWILCLACYLKGKECTVLEKDEAMRIHFVNRHGFSGFLCGKKGCIARAETKRDIGLHEYICHSI